MSIGALAKLAGCAVKTIPHDKKEKFLFSTRRSEGTCRLYDEASAEQLLIITLRLGLGVSQGFSEYSIKMRSKCSR
tara:strand:- start:6508 stop:6735 length:228 start_codon:yes stop_codon:yes gene_type:complete